MRALASSRLFERLLVHCLVGWLHCVCLCMRCIKIFRRNRNNHGNNNRSCHHQLLRVLLLNAVSCFTFMRVHIHIRSKGVASRLCLYFSLSAVCIHTVSMRTRSTQLSSALALMLFIFVNHSLAVRSIVMLCVLKILCFLSFCKSVNGKFTWNESVHHIVHGVWYGMVEAIKRNECTISRFKFAITPNERSEKKIQVK